MIRTASDHCPPTLVAGPVTRAGVPIRWVARRWRCRPTVGDQCRQRRQQATGGPAAPQPVPRRRRGRAPRMRETGGSGLRSGPRCGAPGRCRGVRQSRRENQEFLAAVARARHRWAGTAATPVSGMSGVLWPHIRGHIEVTRPPNLHRPDDLAARRAVLHLDRRARERRRVGPVSMTSRAAWAAEAHVPAAQASPASPRRGHFMHDNDAARVGIRPTCPDGSSGPARP
jgi:hypothetical protein